MTCVYHCICRCSPIAFDVRSAQQCSAAVCDLVVVPPGAKRAEQQQNGRPERAPAMDAATDSADSARGAGSVRRASMTDHGATRQRQGPSSHTVVLDSPESPIAQGAQPDSISIVMLQFCDPVRGAAPHPKQ